MPLRRPTPIHSGGKARCAWPGRSRITPPPCIAIPAFRPGAVRAARAIPAAGSSGAAGGVRPDGPPLMPRRGAPRHRAVPPSAARASGTAMPYGPARERGVPRAGTAGPPVGAVSSAMPPAPVPVGGLVPGRTRPASRTAAPREAAARSQCAACIRATGDRASPPARDGHTTEDTFHPLSGFPRFPRGFFPRKWPFNCGLISPETGEWREG